MSLERPPQDAPQTGAAVARALAGALASDPRPGGDAWELAETVGNSAGVRNPRTWASAARWIMAARARRAGFPGLAAVLVRRNAEAHGLNSRPIG